MLSFGLKSFQSRFFTKESCDLRNIFHVGDTFSLIENVKKQNTYNPTNNKGDDVLSTPQMIDMIENACGVNFLEKKLPPHYSSVGFFVEMSHKKPVQVGKEIKINGEVSEVSQKKISFKTNVYSQDQLVGSGVHKRAVIQFK